jgi:hypothetical protein
MPWRYDNLRGFNHGVFIPLKVAFPRADLPIVQVSLILLNISSLAKPLRLYVTKECYRRQRDDLSQRADVHGHRDAKSRAPDAGYRRALMLAGRGPHPRDTRGACRRPDRLGQGTFRP